MSFLLMGALLALATALPLAWKWQLGVLRSAVFVTVASCAAVLALEPLPLSPLIEVGMVWLLTTALSIGFLAYRFFRDPERNVPERADVLLSPADGEVVYVRTSRAGLLPVSEKHGRSYSLTELTKTDVQMEDAVVVGIAMSFLDVHVNRAPVAGRVVTVRHVAGGFASLRLPRAALDNERATTVIDTGIFQVAVVQIASRLVRQIVTFVREGQTLAAGDRLGVIRLGSQVDLVLPVRDDVRVCVAVGDRMRAGETVVATVQRTAQEHGGDAGAFMPDGAAR